MNQYYKPFYKTSAMYLHETELETCGNGDILCQLCHYGNEDDTDYFFIEPQCLGCNFFHVTICEWKHNIHYISNDIKDEWFDNNGGYKEASSYDSYSWTNEEDTNKPPDKEIFQEILSSEKKGCIYTLQKQFKKYKSLYPALFPNLS